MSSQRSVIVRDPLVGLVFVSMVLLSITVVWLYPQPVQWDQRFVYFVFTTKIYPPYVENLVSQLTVGIYKLFYRPGPAVNEYVRTLSLVLFMGTTYALARGILKSRSDWLLYLVLVFTTGFQFLWLSSELIASSYLFLFFIFDRKGHAMLATAMLALFAMSKPDLVVIAGALLLYRIAVDEDRQSRLRRATAFVGVFVIVNAPGVAMRGLDHFASQRELYSFGQHYGVMLDLADPFERWRENLAAEFPQAETMRDVVVQHPGEYATFVAKSVAYSTRRLATRIPFVLIFVALALYELRRQGWRRRPRFEVMVAVTLIGLVPVLLLSYLHVRYLAKYYPLVVLVCFGMKDSLESRGAKAGFYWLLSGQALLQTVALAIESSKLADGAYFYFPD